MGDTLISHPINSPIPSVTNAPANDAFWAYDPAKDPLVHLNNYSGPLDEGNDGLPYPCRVCRAINQPFYQKEWYVISRGFEVGIVFGRVRISIGLYLMAY